MEEVNVKSQWDSKRFLFNAGSTLLTAMSGVVVALSSDGDFKDEYGVLGAIGIMFLGSLINTILATWFAKDSIKPTLIPKAKPKIPPADPWAHINIGKGAERWNREQDQAEDNYASMIGKDLDKTLKDF